MATPVDRRRWRTALRSRRDIPRTLHLTLVLLAERMDQDGVLTGRREDLAEWLGVPPRTFDRRIADAIEHRWMVQVQRGQKGRLAAYQAAVPQPGEKPVSPARGPVQVAESGELNGGSVRQKVRTEPAVGAPFSSPPGGELHIDGERSDRGALDAKRRRLRDHDGARGAARSAAPSPRLARVIQLPKTRTATADPTELEPAADGTTGPTPGPTTQTAPARRDAGGAGGRRFGPPRRGASDPRPPPPSRRPPT